MHLIMIRHGEIPSNVNKIYAGRSPEKLTSQGVKQAECVGDKLKGVHLHTLYSSPIYRAIQTAMIICEIINRDFIIEDSFRELEMGPWEGLSEKEVAKEYPVEWKVWNTRPADLSLQGRETLDELQRRALSGLRSIYQNASDRRVAIVTHVAVIRVLLLWHANKSLNLYKTVHVPNAEIFELSIESCP